jgi:hypothetical protein
MEGEIEVGKHLDLQGVRLVIEEVYEPLNDKEKDYIVQCYYLGEGGKKVTVYFPQEYLEKRMTD